MPISALHEVPLHPRGIGIALAARPAMSKRLSSTGSFPYRWPCVLMCSWAAGCIGPLEVSGPDDDGSAYGEDPAGGAPFVDDSEEGPVNHGEGGSVDDGEDGSVGDNVDGPVDDGDDEDGDDGAGGLADPPAGVAAAQVLGWDLPAQAQCGERVMGRVTMLNQGTEIWTRQDGYKLGAVNDSDPLHTGDDGRVELPEGVTVDEGQTWTFEIELQMPAEPGTYLTDWQMVQEHVRWFGDRVGQEVEVSCAAPLDDGGGGEPANDCTLWDNSANAACPPGWYNCDCSGHCGADQACDDGGAPAGDDCTLWDNAANAACPPGWLNCDCSGGCGPNNSCDGSPNADAWPPGCDQRARYHGLTNGGRPTFYFDRNMGTYPARFTVTVVGCATVEVPNNNGHRHEGGGLVIKQSEVAGRGMAVVATAACRSDKCCIECPTPDCRAE